MSGLPHRALRICAPAAALPVLAAGCGGRQSTLDADSHASKSIATLWWIMFVGATVVFAVVLLLVVLALLRRRSEPAPPDREESPGAVRFAVIAGGVVPLVVLSGLFVLILRTIPATSAPKGDPQLTVLVQGRQWFWAVEYDGSRAVTANEIHIPTGQDVRVFASTDDVIHSLWVPGLNRKIDTIPGKENAVLFRADKPGTFRGTCAEFCGVQHARMGLLVIAQPPAAFRAWLRNEAAPARGTASAGDASLFDTVGCGGCHTIRGTAANGTIGPDLTHVGSRRTLAAATLANTPKALAQWIRDPQHVKPGNRMPDLHLGAPEVRVLVRYLESLR